MFCLFCREYKGLDNRCGKDKDIHDIIEVIECPYYQYNGDVKIEDS